jgi:Rieske Fe-S protein
MTKGLSRRQFCVVTGAGIVAGACGSGGGGGGGGKDLSAPSDMALGRDMADPTCPANNKLNAGPTTKFAVGAAPTYFGCSHVLVLRDAGGLYAMSAVCTHEGCDVFFATATKDLECPCHQSVFDLNGAVTMSPATIPLPHFAVSVDGGGNVIVDLASPVPAGTRLAVQD